MRWSNAYIPTLKEAPGDAEVVSHRLLLRAGMIRKLTAGVYTWLPVGLRALKKAEQIVREEMDRAGAQEIFMPTVQPGDLWIESGRWTKYGKELLRFKDRHDRDYCLGPTHEEVVTDLLRGEVRSYRQLPLTLYQIQTKFRDEIRPRFGLMRGREFVMKDAYSFDKDRAGLDVSYQKMFNAYKAIFTRLGLKFRPVEADCGSIGGNSSHEFMVLAEAGEDTIAFCNHCDWASNVERAAVVVTDGGAGADCPAAEAVPTPGAHSIEEICAFLGIRPEATVKTLLFEADGRPVAVLLRGDRELNEVKLTNLLGGSDVVFATPEHVQEWTGAEVGFAGPVGLEKTCPDVRLIVDNELRNVTDVVVGANRTDTHLRHVNLTRDITAPYEWADIRVITDGDVCPRCGGSISFAKGIEVGHVFKLGTKYSDALHAVYLDEQGREQVIVMGCYGIGVSRVVAASIEQCNDKDGIAFPPPLAPYQVMLLSLDPANADVAAKVDELEAFFTAEGLDVLVDDRTERPGVKFKDADLLGFPYQIVVGGKGLSRGVIEVKNRRTGEKQELPVEGFADAFRAWRMDVLKSWE